MATSARSRDNQRVAALSRYTAHSVALSRPSHRSRPPPTRSRRSKFWADPELVIECLPHAELVFDIWSFLRHGTSELVEQLLRRVRPAAGMRRPPSSRRVGVRRLVVDRVPHRRPADFSSIGVPRTRTVVTGIETLWVLHRGEGLPAICSLAQTRHDLWTLTITYGSVPVLAEAFPAHARAVSVAGQFRSRLEQTGWVRAPERDTAHSSGG